MKSYNVKLEGNCMKNLKRHNLDAEYLPDEDVTEVKVKAISKQEARKIGAKYGKVVSIE